MGSRRVAGCVWWGWLGTVGLGCVLCLSLVSLSFWFFLFLFFSAEAPLYSCLPSRSPLPGLARLSALRLRVLYWQLWHWSGGMRRVVQRSAAGPGGGLSHRCRRSLVSCHGCCVAACACVGWCCACLPGVVGGSGAVGCCPFLAVTSCMVFSLRMCLNRPSLVPVLGFAPVIAASAVQSQYKK